MMEMGSVLAAIIRWTEPPDKLGPFVVRLTWHDQNGRKSFLRAHERDRKLCLEASRSAEMRQYGTIDEAEEAVAMLQSRAKEYGRKIGVEIVELNVALGVPITESPQPEALGGLAPSSARQVSTVSSAVNNQGRVRSDNVASIEYEGLRFRSPAEIEVFKALKKEGVLVAPNSVWVRGGETYQRIEPDFLVFEGGSLLLIEIDGDTYHTENPPSADQRTRSFKDARAFIEHISATAVDTEVKAREKVRDVLTRFRNWRR